MRVRPYWSLLASPLYSLLFFSGTCLAQADPRIRPDVPPVAKGKTEHSDEAQRQNPSSKIQNEEKNNDRVYRVGAGVSAPVVIHRVEPWYTEEGRHAYVEGVVVLSAIVHKDGSIEILRVIRGLGYGMDEITILAMKQWKFRPGMKNGKPVDVALNIEVNFRLEKKSTPGATSAPSPKAGPAAENKPKPNGEHKWSWQEYLSTIGDLALTQPEATTAVVVVAISIVFGLYTKRKRGEALEKAATTMGFSFERKGTVFLGELNMDLHLLKLGSDGKLINVMRGSSDAGETTLFEYYYTSGFFPEPSTHYQTVAAFRFAGLVLPEFHLGAKHWWHKWGKAFGYMAFGYQEIQIQFEAHPDFGERYLLQGPDEDAVRLFFLPPLLDYFQSLPKKPAWNVDAAGPWLLLYHPNKLAKPDQLRAFRDAAATIAGKVMNDAGIRRRA